VQNGHNQRRCRIIIYTSIHLHIYTSVHTVDLWLVVVACLLLKAQNTSSYPRIVVSYLLYIKAYYDVFVVNLWMDKALF